MRLAQAPAVEDDRIARLELRMGRGFDDPREIDAGDHREAAHHRSLSRERETVLVVQGRMRHPNGDVAFHEVRFVEAAQLDGLARLAFVDDDGFERAHAGPPFVAPPFVARRRIRASPSA
jgi:hypothetical protein